MASLVEAPTAIGSFFVLADIVGVVRVSFPGIVPNRRFDYIGYPLDKEGVDIAEHAADEIKRFIDGTLKRFTVPLNLTGVTSFRQDVYRALIDIPYGQTVTYGDLAFISGHPGSARAVGTAMKNNPISLIIPCHRVVGAKNNPGGWTGPEGMKEMLLSIEKRGASPRD